MGYIKLDHAVSACLIGILTLSLGAHAQGTSPVKPVRDGSEPSTKAARPGGQGGPGGQQPPPPGAPGGPQVPQQPPPPPDQGGPTDGEPAPPPPPPGPGEEPPAPSGSQAARFPDEFRTIDGVGNNPVNPFWGSADSEFQRVVPEQYADGWDSPAGETRPSAREISNACAAQVENIPNAKRVTDMFWQWGQFLDHDLDLTGAIEPLEPFDIAVPTGDPYFDPQGTGTMSIALDRSFYRYVDGVRQQVNEITAFIDASQVYGSDEARATALRKLNGSGQLNTSKGGLLPYNTDGLPNAPAPAPTFFLAGDFRVNEQVDLIAMHTLFLREHNYWARQIKQQHPEFDDEQIYQHARAIVGAEIQAITYREFLPLLLGPRALEPYTGYRDDVNPGIWNVFATAAYRFGHTMLSPELARLDKQMQPIPAGNLPLAQAFFNLDEFTAVGIEPYLRGLSSQVAQEIDNYVIDDVRNFLFGPPGAGGFDLASLNIQRGRDHGLPDYNTVREAYGLDRVTSFAEISSNPDVQFALEVSYGTVDDIDIWVGGLAEDHVEGALVGETFWRILRGQFTELRDGDRFWYEAYLPRDMVKLVNQQKLWRIIRRNTGIGKELPKNVWVAAPPR